MTEIIGIIAGSGKLPELITNSHRTPGKTIIAAVNSQLDLSLLQADAGQHFTIGQVGAIINFFQKHQVTKIILAGAIPRPNLANLQVDLKGAILLSKIAKAKILGDDALLRVVVNYLEQHGFTIASPLEYISGNYSITTKLIPTNTQKQNILHAAEVAYQLGKLDIGQAVIIENNYILGVEAAEGTAELIARCKALQKTKKASILVKIMKPTQDPRIDTPTIGLQTVISVADAGMAGIAIEFGKVIVIDPEEVVAKANELGIFICDIR